MPSRTRHRRMPEATTKTFPSLSMGSAASVDAGDRGNPRRSVARARKQDGTHRHYYSGRLGGPNRFVRKAQAIAWRPLA